MKPILGQLRFPLVFGLLLTLAFPVSALAIGSAFTLSGSDLVVDVDAKWVGCRDGGYYPIRARIRNIGPARKITLQYGSSNSTQKIPLVTRDLTLEQNATIFTTLLIPMVSEGTYGDLRILEGGRALKGLSQSIPLPDTAYQGNRSPQMLIVSSRLEDGRFFNEALQRKYTSGPYSHISMDNSDVVQPNMLPTLWTAYTGLDLLAIPLATLEREISPEARQALLAWVHSGGTLLVYQTGPNAAVLDKLIGWEQRKFAETTWTPAHVGGFRRLELPDPADESRLVPEDYSAGAPWQVEESLFAQRGCGLGKVVRFQESPFPGTNSHWTWLLSHLDQGNLLWNDRHGISVRQPNATFMHFLIPGVGSVPIISFLVLITIFTVVIGPLNYGYFLRKKQLSMLLITVPVLAFGSSLLLVGYSTVANGFSVKSRVRSLTILDQGRNSSLSINRVAYFAGTSPTGGLSFEPTTAVYPIWPMELSHEAWRVNWSDTQHFRNGWLRSRTRTQFLTLSQREQRGRLELRGIPDKPELANGLEWPLRLVYISDAAGELWFAENVSPGSTVQPTKATADHRGKLREILSQEALGLPEGMNQQQYYQNFGSPRPYVSTHGYNDMYGQHDIYNNSQQEKLIRKFSLNSENGLEPRTYFAVLGGNPQLDLGLTKCKELASLHLLLGYLD